MNTLIQLNKFNDIKFEELSHTYDVYGKKYKSCTTVLADYTNKFDVEAQSLRFSEKNNLDQDEVKAEWEEKRNIGGTKGSAVHLVAENYFKNKETPYDDKIAAMDEEINRQYKVEVQMFKDFYSDYKDTLVPVSLELVVYDEEYEIAGMVDCLFFNRDTNELEIWDYKTNKNMRTQNFYGKHNGTDKMKYPLNKFDDCEYNKFSFQLETYKNIIERNTNIKLGQSRLVWLSHKNSDYQVIDTKEVRISTQVMLNHHTMTNMGF
jgi:hypothetical protein